MVLLSIVPGYALYNLSVIHLNIGRRFARSGGCPKAPGSVLLTVLDVGVSCRISYSAVSYLYVSFSGLILSFTCNYIIK